MWLEIINIILEVSNKRKEIEDSRRNKIAIVFENISNLIKDVGVDLSNDVYPHGKCVALKTLSEELMNLVQDTLSTDKWNDLNNMLLNASNIEREYADRKNPDTIKLLREISGKFYANSILFKV